MNVEIANKLAPARQDLWNKQTKDSCLNNVKELIKLENNYESPSVEKVGTIVRDTYIIDKIKINSENEMPIPGLLIKPKNFTGTLEAVIYLNEKGKSQYAGEGGVFEKEFINSGKIVLAVDLSGIGETRDNYSNPKYGSDDHRLGIVFMYNGKTLIGQRVEEVFKCIDVLCNDTDVDTHYISIVGTGRLAPVALHAAALNESIKNVTLYNTFSSWMDIVSDASLLDVMSYIVPGALEYYDLPDLAGSISPGKVVYVNSIK